MMESPNSKASIAYDMFHKVVQGLMSSGAGSPDGEVRSRTSVLSNPRVTWRLALAWFLLGRKFYYDLVLCFGLCSTPYIFNLFAEALHWVIQRHIPAYLQYYLDDFLGIFSPNHSLEIVQKALDWMLALGQQLSLHFQPAKVDGPSTVIEFLRLILDSIKMEAQLPDIKLVYLQELLQSWMSHHSCSFHDLNKLTGYLQFCSQVIPMSRAFIQAMHDFSSSFFFAICSPLRPSLCWWASRLCTLRIRGFTHSSPNTFEAMPL